MGWKDTPRLMTYDLLPMADADVLFYPALFNADESAALLDRLMENIAWQQQTLTMFGKPVQVPRLVAWYGDADKAYSYSGITLQPLAWTPDLLTIRQRVETAAETRFNSVLLNLYRDEKDSVGWHSDDERELGVNPVIASVSFGAERVFQFKHKAQPDMRHSIMLTSGSLLLMRGATQHHWKHSIPKAKQPCAARINLTFRVIV